MNPFSPDDPLYAEWEAQEAAERRSEPEAVLTEEPRERRAVNVTNAADASDWLWKNIGTGPLSGMFRRNGDIVQTILIGEEGYAKPKDGDNGLATISRVDARRLAAEVQHGYWCFRETRSKDGEVTRSRASFPMRSAQDVAATPHYGEHLNWLRGTTHTPLVRKDGSILFDPGYDPATHMLYMPDHGLFVEPVSENPTEEDVAKAAHALTYMLTDFPFTSDNDRVNYLGLLLTPLLRDLIPAPYKMFAINAHQMGSGKTLLASLARIIHGGVFRSEMPEDDTELRKQVTSILDGTTGPVVHIDNVSGTIRSSVLAGLLTSATWDDRILGSSKMTSCVNDRCWVLTGNNINLGGDLIRRTVMISIDPGMPDPQNRHQFKIADLEGWVTMNRGRIIHALLTLVRTWINAGFPCERTSGDGYAQWVGCINGILSVAGIPGTFDAPESRIQEQGSEDEEWGTFLEKLAEVFGTEPFTAKEVLRMVNTSGLEGSIGRPISVESLPGNLGEQITRTSNPAHLGRTLGRWLMNRRGRWCSGLTVESLHKGRDGLTWIIKRYDPPART